MRNLAHTNAAPGHHYGHTVIGADPAVTAIHKATLAAATGHMGKGASSTVAIQLAFGRTDQPQVSNPMSFLRAWLRHACHPTLSPTESAAGWQARCKSIRHAKATGVDPLQQTMSVMSHSIIILLDIGVSPVHPLVWHWADATMPLWYWT